MVDIDHLKNDPWPVRTPPPALLPVFRSRLVSELLALILLDPDRTWTAEELAARTEAAYPTVTRELRRLHEAQLIVPEVVGRSKLWRANDRNPHFSLLARLVAASFGPPQVLAEELAASPARGGSPVRVVGGAGRRRTRIDAARHRRPGPRSRITPRCLPSGASCRGALGSRGERGGPPTREVGVRRRWPRAASEVVADVHR